MKKKGFIAAALTFIALFALVGGWLYARSTVADEYYVTDKASFSLNNSLIKIGIGQKAATASVGKSVYTGSAKLFGVIPLKSVRLNLVSDKSVVVGGEAFGLKMYTNGLIVVGFSDIQTKDGRENPAKEAGIEKGDLLKTLDGTLLRENSDVSRLINEAGGKDVTLTLERNGEKKTVTLTSALCSEDGKYKAGMWVRDSAAGVGMLTFYDPVSGVCAGLGHAICDRDTGIQLSMAGGELVPAAIFDVVRGKAGEAGALCGTFAAGSLGALAGNTDKGIYGLLTTQPEDVGLYEIAAPYEVETGKAQMLCTVDERPAWYEVEITKVNVGDTEKQSMTIRVTDEALLEKTGGILQGMSGSPIIQNGKLIGAVTHVLVNDPAAGYALFAQTMYEEAQTYADTPAETLATSIGGVTVSISPDAA